jgi:F0F1-type ATP synthase membrane subunit c/vacuolar-type H+-ATPase subunit K
MPIQSQSTRDYFSSIKIIFFALLAAQLTFTAVALYLNIGLPSGEKNLESMRGVFLIIALILSLNGLVTGNMIYRSRLRKIVQNPNLNEKLHEFRSTLLIRLAMLEASTLFSLVAYLLTSDLIFIGFAGMTLAYFVFLNPTKATIAFDLELSVSEKTILENPDAMIDEFNQRNYRNSE